CSDPASKGRRLRGIRRPQRGVGRGNQGGGAAGARGRGQCRSDRGTAGFSRQPAGENEVAAFHRLSAGTAPRSERQALQAPPARSLLAAGGQKTVATAPENHRPTRSLWITWL